jgi:hypothetical protein
MLQKNGFFTKEDGKGTKEEKYARKKGRKLSKAEVSPLHDAFARKEIRP